MDIGTVQVQQGEAKTGHLRIATGMDGTDINIPIAVISGSKPGPKLLVEGGLHGIEIATIAICRNLLETIQPEELSGNLILAPQLNPWAFQSSTRQTPHDFQDMNRVFPGTQGSTLSFYAARIISSSLLEVADFVIDCHSCNPPSLHFTIVGEEGNAETRQTSIEMAKAFGYSVVQAGTGYSGTLSGHTLGLEKPTITPEFVFSRRLEQRSVDTGTIGVTNVLKHLGMLPGEMETFSVPGAFDDVLAYQSVPTDKGGICYFTKECGDRVERGEVIAEIRTIWGDEVTTVVSPVEGILIAYPLQANQAVMSGDKIAYVAS